MTGRRIKPSRALMLKMGCGKMASPAPVADSVGLSEVALSEFVRP